MVNEQNNGDGHPFSLEERTARFGESVIRFCKTIQLMPITGSLVDQVVRASTSIGANYCEANDSESKKDFRHKIALCRKESRETKHWLRMLVAAVPELAPEARKLWVEAKELNLIFSSIIRQAQKP
jgi:four helix bundle protein